jgi:hypothetical protein
LAGSIGGTGNSAHTGGATASFEDTRNRNNNGSSLMLIPVGIDPPFHQTSIADKVIDLLRGGLGRKDPLGEVCRKGGREES